MVVTDETTNVLTDTAWSVVRPAASFGHLHFFLWARWPAAADASGYHFTATGAEWGGYSYEIEQTGIMFTFWAKREAMSFLVLTKLEPILSGLRIQAEMYM